MELPKLKTRVMYEGHPAGDDCAVLIVDGGGGTVAYVPERADLPDYECAAEIVRRCNAHNDLLAACEKLMEAAADGDRNYLQLCQEATDLARAAIAAATTTGS